MVAEGNIESGISNGFKIYNPTVTDQIAEKEDWLRELVRCV